MTRPSGKKEQVYYLTSEVNFISKWGTLGQSEGKFMYIWGLTISKDGYVYTTETSKVERIQQFSSEGEFIRTWGKRGGRRG